jgi:hypothetical protein
LWGRPREAPPPRQAQPGPALALLRAPLVGRRDGMPLGQRHSLQNFPDQQVGLNGGQILAHDLSIDPQAKQSRGIARGLSLDQNCGWYAHPWSLCHVQAPVTFSRRADSPRRRMRGSPPRSDRPKQPTLIAGEGNRSGRGARLSQFHCERRSALNRLLKNLRARVSGRCSRFAIARELTTAVIGPKALLRGRGRKFLGFKFTPRELLASSFLYFADRRCCEHCWAFLQGALRSDRLD